MKKSLLRFLSALAVCLLLIMPLSSLAKETHEVTVVCSFYPVRIFAQNALKDVPGVRLETLAPAGTGCLHDFQLMTGDLKKLDGALCLILNGAGMEQSFLPLLTRERADLPLVDCSAGIPLMTEGGEDNPHIWLSPFLAAAMVRNLGDGLSKLLPEHRETILNNTEAYAASLEALGEEMRAALSSFQGKNIVTFHEAFPYFADAMGLNVLASVTVEPDETPSPRLIAETVSMIQESGGCPLFSEPGVQLDALNTIARETGCPVYELDPITDGANDPDAYVQAMRKNLDTLITALSGQAEH